MSGAKIPFEQQTVSFSLKCDQGIYFLKIGKNQFTTLVELSIVQNFQTKFVCNCQTTKTLVFTTVEKAKLAFSCFKFHLRNKNRHYLCLVEMVHIVLPDRRVATTAKKNDLHFWWVSYANHNAAHRNLCHKRKKSFHLWQKLVDSTLVDTVNRKFNCILNVHTFSSQWSHMIFSVSNNGTEWSLDFRPNSVTLTVKDVVRENTISSQGILLAAWSLLLSQKQDILNNQLAQVLNTPNQEGTIEIRDEVPSTVGA